MAVYLPGGKIEVFVNLINKKQIELWLFGTNP